MLLRHSLFYAIGQGGPGLVNFLAIAAYTRLLTPEAYGRYALVLAGVGLANSLLFEWLRIGLLRFLPLQGERPERLLATIAATFLAVALLTLAALAALPLLDAATWRLLLPLGLVLLWVQVWFDLNLTLARSRLEPVRYGLMALARAVLALLLGVGLILQAGLEAQGPLAGLAAAMLIAWLLLMPGAWRGLRPAHLDRALLKELMVYGLPLAASFALAFVVNSSDRFLIAWFLGSEATGLYAAGYGVAWSGVMLLLTSVNLAAYPLAVRALENEGREAARVQLRHNFLLLALLGLPAVAGITLLAPNIARVMLGEAFRVEAVRLMPFVALAALLVGLKIYFLDFAFQLGRSTIWQVWIMLATAGVNLALNWQLIPRLGIIGAIYATIAAYLLACVLSFLAGRRVFPLPAPPRETLKIVLATLVMALVLWPLRPQEGPAALALQLLAGALAYGLVLLLADLAGCRRLLAARLALLRARPVPGRE
jgi:O-antigen/teichoic acid export membrane protein